MSNQSIFARKEEELKYNLNQSIIAYQKASQARLENYWQLDVKFRNLAECKEISHSEYVNLLKKIKEKKKLKRKVCQLN